MLWLFRYTWITANLLLVSQANAQPTLPPRFAELPKLAANWPPAWAALIHELVPAKADVEKSVLTKLDTLLRADKPSTENFRRADIVLVATLRHRQSMRQTAPLASDPPSPELADRLATLRKDWLTHLRTTGDTTAALSLAGAWLPTTARDSALSPAILRLWLEQASTALEKMDYLTTRTWLNRVESDFEDDTAADMVRRSLRDRAEHLLKEAQAVPDAPAIRLLEEALTLWPRLPEARDALERRKGTYRTLVIGVRSLPDQLSPATASTVAETQALALLFDRLHHIEHLPVLGKRYTPQVAASLPIGGMTFSIPLRRDVYWSSGARLTAADFRHTALLMNQTDAANRSALWRDYLEIPRLEGNRFQLHIGYRQGLLDPLAPLGFHVLPQMVRGKQLDRADDPAFASAPVGSGPFQYVGRKVEGSKTHAVFQANPYDLRGGARSLREIRMIAWSDARKDLPKPLPRMILDAPTDQLSALKEKGYVEVPISDDPSVYFLAVNHRKPTLASAPVRRALAHALDRQDLLNRHFRGDAKDKYHASANGLFARASWVSCPAPRVPQELFQKEQAQSFARQAKKDIGAVEWTLKYPAGDAHVQKACEEIAGTMRTLLTEAGIKAAIDAQALPPRELRKALQERDFDLLYMSAHGLDDPVHLALLFDPHADATRAGGSNILGYDSDIKLQELLQGALKHRQFSVAQASMHAVHAHFYETMPCIPLWQLDMHVLIQPTLRLPALESRDVFARVREWQVGP